MSRFVIINGEFVPDDQARLHVSDLSIQRGYGIFDFFITVAGRPAFLDDHLARFVHSAQRMRLDIGRTPDSLKSLLLELLERNKLPDSGVRITLTGGYSPDGYTITAPNLIITQRPIVFDTTLAERGVRLITHPHQRQMPDVKTIDYLMAIWLQPLARERGADDVLYHQDGVISECPRSNIFIVTADQRIITPGDRVLKGIIRKQTLKIADSRFTTQQRDIRIEELGTANEILITSTTKGVVPVVSIDGQPVGTGAIGETTRWLRNELERLRRNV